MAIIEINYTQLPPYHLKVCMEYARFVIYHDLPSSRTFYHMPPKIIASNSSQ